MSFHKHVRVVFYYQSMIHSQLLIQEVENIGKQWKSGLLFRVNLGPGVENGDRVTPLQVGESEFKSLQVDKVRTPSPKRHQLVVAFSKNRTILAIK